MESRMNPNAVNQFLKGTEIYLEGEPVTSVAMIVKGRVLMKNEGAKVIMSSGAFIGINDLYEGKYQSSYTAYDDLMIYVFSVNGSEDLETILSFNKDYHGFMVASFYKMIYELDQVYKNLMKNGMEIYQYLRETYQNCLSSADQRGLKIIQSDRIDSLKPMDDDMNILNDRIGYYSECRNLPMDAVKLFYSYGNAITTYQIEDQVNIVNQQIEILKQLSEEFCTIANCLVDNSDSCLFRIIIQLSSQTDNISGMDLMDIMDNIIEMVNQAEMFADRMLGRAFKVNRSEMEEGYHMLLTGNAGKAKDVQPQSNQMKEDTQKALSELKDAFDKILDYAEIDSEQAPKMRSVMDDFVNIRDKHSSDDAARAIRRKLTENHYIIYEKVFMRAYKEGNPPRVIDLFLKYGFADDRLLTNEQMLSLYFLKEEYPDQEACNVYDIKTWLSLIYEGKKEPSKNEFDQEYPEMVASLKKQGRLNEQEVKQWLTDPDKKLEYEIQNMFRYNNRTTNGQITSFVPVLYQDQCTGYIEKMQVTANRINEAVAKIMKIDYSVFDREVIFSNKDIVKEYIIKRIYPDVILMPNAGSNGIMWQEISGKRRDSAGRFILPILTDADLNTLFTRIFGRFRWELCRTIEGTSWNDITVKSLTAEYSDYLQFYRKNKDLSEEKKDKIKQQIQKGRNNSREIFVIDYEQWVNYEAAGAVKLNKIVREIMATYCPFSKELREKFKLQPVFAEATIRYNREKLKKIREVEGRFRVLQKDKIEITPELTATLEYHRDL